MWVSSKRKKADRMVGGLWTNGGVGSGVQDAQRGSLELSNSTMETFFQQPGNNCFTCHGYTPAPAGNPLLLSHIVCALLPQGTTHCPTKLLIQTRKESQNFHKKLPKKE